jgi:hypothetical protein
VGRRNIKAGILDRRSHAISTLAHRGVRQPHRVKMILVRLDSGKINFNIDNVRVDAVHSGTKGLKEHNFLSDKWLEYSIAAGPERERSFFTAYRQGKL